MYAEIVYETGRSSVAFYDSEEEAKSALKEHHRRAVAGEAGGPVGAPAERIKTVYLYDKHPNEYNPSQSMTTEVAEKEVAALIGALADENGVIDVATLAAEVRALTHPMAPVKEAPFDSNFKMQETGKLNLDFLGDK